MSDLDFSETLRGYSKGMIIAGRFRLVRLLGRGGMGIVWLADDQQLERQVALKFLPEVLMDPNSVREMKRETRRALELTHANIVRIHDFVQTKTEVAISMEYVAGPSLARLAADQPEHCFEVDAITRWMEQLCEALTYAHERAHIIHRDLKPANLMTDATGDLRVTDFGISVSVNDSMSRVSLKTSTSGTPVYMSPQQMMGEKPAPGDDIYSVGATIFELLTGKPPFYSGNVVLQVQTKTAPSIIDRRAELEIKGQPIPAHWEAAVAACLAKTPEERPKSAHELAALLGLNLATSSRGSSRPAIPAAGFSATAKPAESTTAKTTAPLAAPVRQRALFAIVLIALALVAAGSWWWRHGRGAASTIPALAVPAPAAKPADIDPPSAVLPAVSPEQDPPMTVEVEPIPVPMVTTPADAREMVLVLGPGINLTLRRVEPGSFLAGSPEDEIGRQTTETRQIAQVDRAFYLGVTEVTQAQYSVIMGRHPSHFRFNNDAMPVEQVRFSDLLEPEGFVVALNRWLHDNNLVGWSADLPTEAEWEYACRAGTRSAFNDGSPITNSTNDPALRRLAVFRSTQPRPVAQMTPNAWGFFDMHGNVAEWTRNGVLRGGSYRDDAAFCRAAARLRGQQDSRMPDSRFGFRLVLRPPQQ